MSDPWKLLFDNEWRQRQDIETTKVMLDATESELGALATKLRRAERRADKLELLLEGLLTYLEASGTVDREGLAVWTARLDLADGVEDGRIGPDQARRAPACGGCGRPVNPKRERCLYCGAAVRGDAPPPVRTVDCRKCAEAVPESEVYFTERGMVCAACYVP